MIREDDLISRQEVLEGIRNLYPDIPIVDIMGARRKWLEKYAPYFECENVVEQLPACEKKQEQTRDKKIMDDIDFSIKATDSQDDYSMGMRNGMRYVKSLIDGKEPQYELRRTDEEKKLLIDIGDEVIGDYGSKGVVIGIDTYKGETILSLLMKNHKVPQLVKASMYKTKTGRYFPQIVEILDQIGIESEE